MKELSDKHHYLKERTPLIRRTLPSLLCIRCTASKETPTVRVRVLLHPVDTFVSMAVTSLYPRSSQETATQHCDSCVIYYNRLHWPREFGFGSTYSVPSNFLICNPSSRTSSGLDNLSPLPYTERKREQKKDSLHLFRKTHKKRHSLFCPLEKSLFIYFWKTWLSLPDFFLFSFSFHIS
jgi:hypothetical protein